MDVVLDAVAEKANEGIIEHIIQANSFKVLREEAKEKNADWVLAHYSLFPSMTVRQNPHYSW